MFLAAIWNPLKFKCFKVLDSYQGRINIYVASIENMKQDIARNPKERCIASIRLS